MKFRIATFLGRLCARLFMRLNAPQSKRLIFIFPSSLERVVLYCNPRTKVRVHPSILLESSNALIFTSTDSHCLHSLREAAKKKKKRFFFGDLSQMWVGGVANSQTRSKHLKTPPNHPENRLFRP